MFKKAFGIGLAAVLAAAAFSGYSSNVNAAGNLTTELSAAPQKNAKSAPKAAPKGAKAAPKGNVAKKGGGGGKNANKGGGGNKNANKGGGGGGKKGGGGGNKNANNHHHNHGSHHSWSRRAYYGSAFIGAAALGTILVVGAPHVIPVVPGDNACWYWTDPSETRGYWDYCVAP